MDKESTEEVLKLESLQIIGKFSDGKYHQIVLKPETIKFLLSAIVAVEGKEIKYAKDKE